MLLLLVFDVQRLPEFLSRPMPDLLSTEARSKLMSRVRQRGTTQELLVRRVIRKLGHRASYNAERLPGRPDVILPDLRTAIFVHGCFWHRHRNCRATTTPTARQGFWLAKFAANVARDKVKAAALRKLGWRVVVVWGCNAKDESELMVRLSKTLALQPKCRSSRKS
jgi:DNA mismatch endonuclease (patch repair protein)